MLAVSSHTTTHQVPHLAGVILSQLTSTAHLGALLSKAAFLAAYVTCSRWSSVPPDPPSSRLADCTAEALKACLQ
jgi:hypothetical protein